MLTLIGGERQRSPAMVRQLGRCLSTVRVASGEASAPRMAEASSFSTDQLLRSAAENLNLVAPRVRRVLHLRSKILHYMWRYI
jgi:hypothetical protein